MTVDTRYSRDDCLALDYLSACVIVMDKLMAPRYSRVLFRDHNVLRRHKVYISL
jgi:hypothetical protein